MAEDALGLAGSNEEVEGAQSTLEDERSFDAGCGTKQRRMQVGDATEGTWQGTPARKMAGVGSRAWGGDTKPAGSKAERPDQGSGGGDRRRCGCCCSDGARQGDAGAGR